MQLSMFSSEERPASRSASRASGLDLLTLAETSASRIWQSLTAIAPTGASGRMFRAYCRPATDGILEPSSEGWGNSGMGSPTECLTLNTSESTGLDGLSLNDDGVCSLSDILETGDVPQRYYLTPRACAGILRRAEKRGKELPLLLREALKAVAGAATPGEGRKTM